MKYGKRKGLVLFCIVGILIAAFIFPWTVRADEEQTEEQTDSGTLRCAASDFYDSDKKTIFLGVEEVKRQDLVEVVFQSSLEGMPANAFDVSEKKNGSIYLWEEKEDSGKFIIASEGGVRANENSEYLFMDCKNLRAVDFNYSFLSSEVIDMEGMFQNCKKLETINFSGFSTDSAENLKSMFEGCKNLEKVYVGSFDTSNVRDMRRMFYGCESLQTLNISNFAFHSVYTKDMFTGTRWEGSSPLLDDVEYSVDYSNANVFCGILDTGDWLINQPQLRTAVIEDYTSQLYSMNIFTSCDNTMYALEDLDDDDIPELIWRGEYEGKYYYKIFCFQIVCCASKDLVGEDHVWEWGKDLLYRKGYGLFWKTDEGEYVQAALDEGEINQTYASAFEHPEQEAEPVHFIKVKPSQVYYDKKDINGDGTDENVYILVAEDEEGPDYYAVCVGGTKLYGAPVGENWTANVSADVSMFMEEGEEQDSVIYFRVHYHDDTYAQEFLKLDVSSWTFQSIASLDDFVEEEQLYAEDKEYNYFYTRGLYSGNISMYYRLNTLGFGKISFYMDYSVDSNGPVQTGWLYDLSAGSSEWFEHRDYTLIGKTDFYKKPGSSKKAYTLQEGDLVTPDWVWLSDRILWVRVKDEKGRTGWIPASATVFYETSAQAWQDKNASFAEQNKKILFGSKQPNGGRLFEEGEKYFEEGKYQYALFYYGMIKKLDGNYTAAKERIKEAKKLYTEKLFAKADDLLDESDYRSVYACLEGLTEGSDDPEVNQELERQDYLEAKELLVNESELLQKDSRYQQYLSRCDAFFEEQEEKEKVPEAWQQEKQSSLLAELQRQSGDSGRPLCYCTVDIDGDGIDELITKSQQNYIGTISYNVYKYSEENEKYEEASGGAIAPAKPDGRIFQWEKEGCLLLEDYDEEQNDVLQEFVFSENYLIKDAALHGPGNCFRELEFQEYETGENETSDDQELSVLWSVE